MSAVLRDRVYRISGWGTTEDWVVLRRERDGTTRLQSATLQTTIVVHESKLVVVDRDTAVASSSVQLFLNPGASDAPHGTGAPNSQIASPDAWPVQSTSPGLHRQPLPVARATDPDTAHLAAATARGAAAASRLKVLLAHRDAGERGLTGWELEQATQTPYETLGPRRPSLEADGLIVATNERRPNGRGNLERVYRVTEAGRITADRAVA